MADHLLSAIIALEKELQLQVQEELVRAAAWRERQFAALAREEQQLRTVLQAARASQVEAARQAAVDAREQALTETTAWCTRLADLPEELCAVHLAPLVRTVLPEDGDDHPHGQS